jgi:hypothetical protein
MPLRPVTAKPPPSCSRSSTMSCGHSPLRVVRLRIIRVKLQSLPVTCHSFVELALLHQDNRQVVVGQGQIRLQSQGQPKTGHRLLQPSQGRQHQSQVEAGLDKVGLQPQRLADTMQGEVVTAGLVGDQTEQMERRTFRGSTWRISRYIRSACSRLPA